MDTENNATAVMKFCKFCGQQIASEAIICPKCGRQIEQLQNASGAVPNIVIQNTNTNANTNITGAFAHMRARNKWTAFLLCMFLGIFGAHKFYEGKAGMGIFYLLTAGLFGIGVIVDLIVILTKPNPYYI